jgi:hypothetical protein
VSVKTNGQEKKRRQTLGAYNKQDGLCWYCGVKCWIAPRRVAIKDVGPNMATLEHRFSRWIEGGTAHRPRPSNEFVMACYKCNHSKGNWSDALNRSGARMVHPRGGYHNMY